MSRMATISDMTPIRPSSDDTLNSPSYTFRKADFTSPALHSLLQTHHATVTNPASNVPGQKTYALDLTTLQAPDIHLWTIRSPDATESSEAASLLGCAALKVLQNPPLSGELKSMHTVFAARGRGVGKAMLDKVVEEARKLGLHTLYLETGSMDAFREARRFYAGQEFVECGPFGDYEVQENSVFMRREIPSCDQSPCSLTAGNNFPVSIPWLAVLQPGQLDSIFPTAK